LRAKSDVKELTGCAWLTRSVIEDSERRLPTLVASAMLADSGCGAQGQMSHADVEEWRVPGRSLRSRDGRKRPSPHKRFKNRELWTTRRRNRWERPLTIESGTEPRDALEC
jgi:hypothetical protein